MKYFENTSARQPVIISEEELYIDSVAHRYGVRPVLSNVYLNCKKGEVVGLLGRNGSGKSTLLKIIFGSINPHYKYLKINGKPIHKSYLTGQVAYLPQDNFIPPYLRIKFLADIYTNIYKKEFLDLEIIRINLEERIGNLSGGQYRLIECLLILYSDAGFVLLDEPFSQLAPMITEEIQNHIQRLKSEKGIILTDHYYRQILEVSSRVVLLHNGCNYTIKTEQDLILHGYLPDIF